MNDEVPVSEMFPLAKGVPAVGRTWIPDQVIWSISLLLLEATVMVIVLEVTVADEELSVRRVPFGPDTFATVAVTGLAVLKAKPEGACRMIVPVPIVPAADSAIVGPGKVVHVAPAVSAEMELPPVALVTVTVAANAPSAHITIIASRARQPRIEPVPGAPELSRSLLFVPKALAHGGRSVFSSRATEATFFQVPIFILCFLLQESLYGFSEW